MHTQKISINKFKFLYNTHCRQMSISDIHAMFPYPELSTNSVALREMAQRNVEWYSVDTNSVALGRIALQNIRRSI